MLLLLLFLIRCHSVWLVIKCLASVGRDSIIKRIRATKEEGVEGELKKTVTKYTCMKALHKEVLQSSHLGRPMLRDQLT